MARVCHFSFRFCSYITQINSRVLIGVKHRKKRSIMSSSGAEEPPSRDEVAGSPGRAAKRDRIADNVGCGAGGSGAPQLPPEVLAAIMECES